MAGLLDGNIGVQDIDARLSSLYKRLTEMSDRPLGGKSVVMGESYPGNVRAADAAYDARMNQMEAEFQDLLVRKHGPKVGLEIFGRVLPNAGVWAGLENRRLPKYP